MKAGFAMWKYCKRATLSGALLSGALLSGGLLLVAGCGQPAPPQPKPAGPSPASQAWSKLSNAFIEDYMLAQPAFAVQAGRHEFDGQLPDMSAHGIKREIARLNDEREQIESVDPATLEPRERFDREYLMAVVDKDLFWIAKTKFPYTNPAWYLSQIDPDVYLSRNYAPLDVRMKSYIKYAQAIPKMAASIKENLKSPMPKTYVELGIDEFGGLAQFYTKNVAAVFASVSDPVLQQQLKDADAAAAQAMTGLKDYLIGERKHADDSYALGPELFAQMIKQTEQVDLPVEQIEAAGRADLERNTASLKAECGGYAPKASLAQCIAKMAANKPKGGPVEEARNQLKMLKEFIVQHNVVSIPSNDEALVAEAPPYNRSNAAFINTAGPYDKGVVSVYNIAPPDPKWTKAEQAAYIPGEAVLLFTSAHEVWPGHFLQFLHSNANPDKLEGLWVGYAFAEGWAHYCEEMMVEMGLAKDNPERHIGQLSEALLRDVRLLSAIGLHTHGMSVAQSEKMFRERAFQDPGNARQQAARGTYDPAYLNYTLGKLMIRKLRTDWLAKTAAPGSASSADDQSRWHEFHDKFLSYGGPPIPLLRKEMVGTGGSLL
ncbi:MAG TPA: DUF885 domain-containing protein [Steroidobacteraceae bacterium]|jgi:hypothetical protein|nr:DUF885 domain-containing protein [Steroidobacteraceae bacterium]